MCESTDVLGIDRDLAVAEGDLLAILAAGAYGMAMASNYNSARERAECSSTAAALKCARDRHQIDLRSTNASTAREARARVQNPTLRAD